MSNTRRPRRPWLASKDRRQPIKFPSTFVLPEVESKYSKKTPFVKRFTQKLIRSIPGTYATEEIEIRHEIKGAGPMNNDHRAAGYKNQTGRSELTPRQSRRVRHVLNKVIGDKHVG
jgi:hypothetical protein